MSLKDAQRIVRYVISNSREIQGPREETELYTDFSAIFATLLTETTKKYGYLTDYSLALLYGYVAWQAIVLGKNDELFSETTLYKDDIEKENDDAQ